MDTAAPAADDQKLPPALIPLVAVTFINMVGFGVVVPLLPFFAKALDAQAWQITIMFSAYSCGQFLGEPFWGRLSDKIGRKRVLQITVAGNAVSYVALAFAPTVWVAIAIRLFTGFAAGNISTIQGYVADVTPPRQRAGRMGLIGAAFGLGFIVGPTLGGLLSNPSAGAMGYQPPLFVAAGMALLSAISVTLFLKESRVHAPPPPSPWTSIGDARAHPVISRVLLVNLIYMAGFSGMESTFGLWSQASFGWTAREVGLCFMGVGIVSAVGQGLLTGRLTRRFGEAKVLACGLLIFGASLVIQTLIPSGGVGVSMAVGAFGVALAMPTISSIISQSSPPGRQGSMLGLNMATGSSARIVGPFIAGFAFTLGHNLPFWIAGALTVPAAFMAVNAGRALNRWRIDQAAVAAAE
jgi:DHA1 family tetracycline resistance protein-like MFS transporter